MYPEDVQMEIISARLTGAKYTPIKPITDPKGQICLICCRNEAAVVFYQVKRMVEVTSCLECGKAMEEVILGTSKEPNIRMAQHLLNYRISML